MKNFVPLGVFLRRNPNLAAIKIAIAETVATSKGLSSVTEETERVVRTEPVQMSDGRLHSVHVWCGPADTQPPERPVPGPVIWNLTMGESTCTAQFLINAGMDPATEPKTGRSFAEDIPSRDLNRDEVATLSMAIDAQPGRTYATTWEFTDKKGRARRVGWAARSAMELAADGSVQLISRAVNLVEEVMETPLSPGQLAQRIVAGLSQPGVYRSIVNLHNWTLLKWLDDPCPYFNWRDRVLMHPDDGKRLTALMMAELRSGGMASGVMRLPGNDGGWTPLHITVGRVDLDGGTYGGLVAVRLPTDGELSEAGLAPVVAATAAVNHEMTG